ncbi:MAG: response regulator transcription factor [Acutalibacter sp.]|nr:response regulator transcription factor [Acutalibacter sp.]
MLRLAICDDDLFFLEQAEKLILEYNQSHKSEYGFEVKKYVSPTLLLDDIHDGTAFELFLLDMEMPEMSGIDLAMRIRGELPNAVIAFLSAHTEYQFTQEGYKVQAIRYIAKLMMETALPEALEAATKVIGRTVPNYFVYTHYSDTVRIPYSEILYLRKNKRMTVFHTIQKEYQMKSSLREVLEKLADARFAHVDQSTVVNLDRIVHLTESEVTLSDGMKLPVSRKMMPSLKSSLLRLWGELS